MVQMLFKRLFGRPQPVAPLPGPLVEAPFAPANLDTGVPIERVLMSRATHQGLDFRNRRFTDLNANKAKFVACNFSYSIFERGYFHSAEFENCLFVGCRFYDCNLRGASFYGCDLKYTTFHRTLVEPREVLATLPLEPNLRREALQNLRANAGEIGDFANQRLYVLEEVRAAMDHYSRAMRGDGAWYQRKYGTLLDKARAGLALVWLRLGGFVWGHGERPFRIAVSAVLLIFVLSLVNLWAVLPRVGWETAGGGVQVLRYSVDLFLDAQPAPQFRGFLAIDYALIAMRYVYIGLFISVLFKSVSHR